MLYDSLLFLHIVGVIAWLGGAFTLTVLGLQMARDSSPAVRGSLAQAGEFFGRKVFGPAAGLILVTGVVMVGLTGWRVPAWVIWGLCGLFASGFIGAVLVGRAARALAALSAGGGVGTPVMNSLRRRLALFSTLDVLILLSVVAAMVFKPTF